MSGRALAIFDCDGVLVDSEPIADRVWAAELARAGLPWSAGEVGERLIGLSDARAREIVEEHLGAPLPPGFAGRVRQRTFEALRRELRAVAGVEEALARIRGRIATCVASSGEREKIRLSLALTGLLPYFDGRLFGAEDVARGKPHPDLFLHAAERMGAAPGDCAVVEDSLPGVRAAVAAGMEVFGYVPRGDGAALVAAGARAFSAMRELPGLLGSGDGGDLPWPRR